MTDPILPKFFCEIEDHPEDNPWARAHVKPKKERNEGKKLEVSKPNETSNGEKELRHKIIIIPEHAARHKQTSARDRRVLDYIFFLLSSPSSRIFKYGNKCAHGLPPLSRRLSALQL